MLEKSHLLLRNRCIVRQTARVAVCALAALAVLVTSAAPLARADDLAAYDTKVKQSADAYDSAVAEQQRIANEMTELDGKIAEIEKELPKQKARSDESFRALYKYQSDSTSVVMMLLDSDSITDMLALADSYSWIIEYNMSEIEKTAAMKKELVASRETLEADKVAADTAASNALAALEQAKADRAAAQAAALAAQKAEAEKQQAAIDASTTTSKAKKQEQKQQVEQTAAAASASNVGWSDDKTAFVNKWAPRIDAYLAGSPTAGTGKLYAAAAWAYGVDPRWAPAISCIESGKGAACFRSHNAWGYGGSNYASWEEGINAVVSGLGSPLYGGYLTHEGAEKYCPGTAGDWYNKVAAQMALI